MKAGELYLPMNENLQLFINGWLLNMLELDSGLNEAFTVIWWFMFI